MATFSPVQPKLDRNSSVAVGAGTGVWPNALLVKRRMATAAMAGFAKIIAASERSC